MKDRVTWVSPKSHDKCHTEERLTEERGEGWVKTEARWSHVATTKEYLGPPEPGRGKGGLSLTASGQWRLADALILNFSLLELSENEFLLFLGHLKLYQVGVQFLSIRGAIQYPQQSVEFLEPSWLPKSINAQVPYINWCSICI